MKDEEAPAEQVVIGIVLLGGRILVQPRADDPAFEGRWEFPGGKCAPGEGHAAALTRELLEETGLAVRVGALVLAHSHTYPDRRITLYAYICISEAGPSVPAGCQWLSVAACRALPMPAANGPILDALDWTLSHPA